MRLSAVQVNDGKGWGTLTLATGDSPSVLADLELLMWRWRWSNYFGIGATFRVYSWER